MATLAAPPDSPATERTCAHCGGAIPPDRDPASPYCAKRCTRAARRRRDFYRAAKAPRTIEAVAAHFDITVDEAIERAMVSIKQGDLVGLWQGGRLAFVSSRKPANVKRRAEAAARKEKTR